MTPTYDPRSQTYRVQYDSKAGQSICYTIIKTIGAITDQEPTNIRPLQESIDTDSLTSLVDRSPTSDWQCTFMWEGFPITIRGDGEIEVDVSNEMRGGSDS